MEFEMETAQQTREPPPMENQVEKSALLDLNAPPRESMMIIPTPTIPQPNTGRTVYHMTFQPSWNQTTIHNIPRRDITQTTTIHSYHYIQTHTPIQVDPPRITHLPGPDEILPFPDHPSLPKPYTVENPPNTPPPPKTPINESQPMVTDLSPFLNRMTLKRAHTEEEEEWHAPKRSRTAPFETQQTNRFGTTRGRNQAQIKSAIEER